MKNYDAMVNISNTLMASMIPHSKRCTTANGMWEIFAKMFIGITSTRKMQLKTQLQHIKMEKGTIISDYVAK